MPTVAVELTAVTVASLGIVAEWLTAAFERLTFVAEKLTIVAESLTVVAERLKIVAECLMVVVELDIAPKFAEVESNKDADIRMIAVEVDENFLMRHIRDKIPA